MSKALRASLLGIVIAILAIYIGGTFYAKHMANQKVDNIISILTKNYSKTIQAIHYQSIDANFFTLFNDDLAINGLSVQFTQQPDNPLHIAQVEITHYDQTQAGIPLEFTLRLKQVQFDSFKRILMAVAQREDTTTYLSLLPIGINPAMNISAVYEASSQSLNFKYSLSNQGQTLLQSNLVLNQLVIKESLLNSPGDAFLTALDSAAIVSGKDKLSYHNNLDQEALVNTHGHIAQLLKDLGYKTTQLDISGTGDYNSDTQKSQFTLQVSLENGGVLNQHVEYTYTKPRTMHNLVSFIRSGNYPSGTENDAKLAVFMVDYQDQSLVSRIINMIAQNAQQSPGDVTNMLVTSLTQTAAGENVPQFKTALQQFANFINKPNLITLIVHPAKPYSINAINTFITDRFKEETAFNKSLAKVDPADRLAQYQAHQQARDAKLSKFLTQLGFSVLATPIQVTK